MQIVTLIPHETGPQLKYCPQTPMYGPPCPRILPALGWAQPPDPALGLGGGRPRGTQNVSAQLEAEGNLKGTPIPGGQP